MFKAKWWLAGAVLSLAACSSNHEEPAQLATSANIGVIPTSANCANVGGVTTMTHTLNGDAIRMCQLPNGKQCEDSALSMTACAK